MNECQAEPLKESVYGSVLRSLIFSDSFPIPKANPAWTRSTYPWFLKGLNSYAFSSFRQGVEFVAATTNKVNRREDIG